MNQRNRSKSSPRGMNDQRDRGRRKKDHRAGKHQSADSEQGDAFARFESWLENEWRQSDGTVFEPSQSVSLKKFLQSSAHFDSSPDERLRILAIHWESECADMKQPNGWHILRQIYRHALSFDSKWPTLYHSISLSARACANWLKSDSSEKKSLLAEAINACREGLEVDPDYHDLHLSLGRCEYELGNSSSALTHFENAVESEINGNWARLFLAHCHHDLENWTEAAEAYRAVDQSFFSGDLTWRATTLRDQLAQCLLRIGERETALDAFRLSLHRYENNPGLLDIPRYLIDAAQGELREELCSATIALLDKEGFVEEADSLRG